MFEAVSTVSVVLFIVGIALLMIELFIPGLGIFFGLGIVSLVLCIVFQASSVAEALLLILIIGAIVVVFVLLAARSMRRGLLYRSSIVLKDTAQKDQGYIANEDRTRFTGKSGISLTTLRPTGTANFNGEKVDVLTDGEFIPSGTHIEVTRVVGARIFVRQSEE